MKTSYLSLLAVVAFGVPAFAQAPVGPGSVKLGKVQPAMVKTPEFNLTSGPTKRSRPADWLEIEVEYETKPEDIDELTFKYTVQFEKKLLDGEVSYVNVAQSREHFAVIYISPKAIAKLTKGKPMTAASIENVWVEVSKSGQVLDKASHKPGPVPSAQHISGFLLRKDQTPFAPLFYDRYEEIKSTR